MMEAAAETHARTPMPFLAEGGCRLWNSVIHGLPGGSGQSQSLSQRRAATRRVEVIDVDGGSSS